MSRQFCLRKPCLALYLCWALALLTLLSACVQMKMKSTETTPAQGAAKGKPVAITTAQAVSHEVPEIIQVSGSFAAAESSNVAPEASGQVVATPVNVGAFVKSGTVIARLADHDARLRLQQVQAAERQAAAALRQAEVGLGLGPGGNFDVDAIPEVRAARQNLELAEAQARLAQSEAQHNADLFRTGDVSRSVYDQAQMRAETAQAQAKVMRQQLEVAIHGARQSNQGVASAAAALAGARSQVALAQKAVDDTIVKAPFTGFISERPVAAGEYVTPASKIVTLLQIDPIKLRLQLPEMDAGRVRLGMSVAASVAAYPERNFLGKVTAINPAVDPASRAVSVEVSINNSAKLLRPGMFTTARIIQPGGKTGVYVPRAALVPDPTTNSSHIFVIDHNTARVRVVQVGEQENDLMRIISGLSAGEVVATSNLEQLFDGAQVERR